MLLLCLFLPVLIIAQTLSGTVRDCNGSPVPNATIYIQFPSVYTGNTTTDAGGNWNYTLWGNDPKGNYTISCRVLSYGGTPNSQITSPKSGFYLFTKTIENQIPPFSMDFTITAPFIPSFKIDKIVASPTDAIPLLACPISIRADLYDNTTVNPQLVDKSNYEVAIFNSNSQGQVLSVHVPSFSGAFPTDILRTKPFTPGNYYIIRIGYNDFCGNTKYVDGLIRVDGLPPILVDFKLLPPIGAGPALINSTIFSYPELGSLTAGIVNITQYTGNYTLNVRLKETGLTMGQTTITNPGPNYIVYFNDILLKNVKNYFRDNWAKLKDKEIFEVIVRASNSCSFYETRSYFKITGACQFCFVQLEKSEIDAFNEKEANSQEQDFNVFFPNPVTDNAFIKVKDINDSAITIYNSAGQKVEVLSNMTLTGYELEMSALAPGIYFYHLKVKDTLYKGKISKI